MHALPTVTELKSPSEGPHKLFSSVFVVRKAQSRKARNGDVFYTFELGDATGNFTVNVFSKTLGFDFCPQIKENDFLKVEGQANYYKENFSPVVHGLWLLSAEESKEYIPRMVSCSKEDPKVLWKEYQKFLETIQNIPLRQTVVKAVKKLEERFKECTAAISVHHSFRHGLLEHSVHCARAAKALLELYPQVHYDLAMAGVLLHDIGKVLEYEGTFAYKRTREGILQGHVVLGYRLIREAAIECSLSEDYLERLEHIILSHQGQLEWGAVVLSATPEALLVSLVDNLDAKMGILDQLFRNNGEGKDFVEVYGLHDKLSKFLIVPPRIS